jgi:hypothetical protein
MRGLEKQCPAEPGIRDGNLTIYLLLISRDRQTFTVIGFFAFYHASLISRVVLITLAIHSALFEGFVGFSFLLGRISRTCLHGNQQKTCGYY